MTQMEKNHRGGEGNSPWAATEAAALDLNHATPQRQHVPSVALGQNSVSKARELPEQLPPLAAAATGSERAAPRDAIKAKKLQRARGGCLGTRRRRRTWRTAICDGELYASARAVDFRMGQPIGPTSHCCTPCRANAEK